MWIKPKHYRCGGCDDAKDIPGSHYHGVIIKDWPDGGFGEKVRLWATQSHCCGRNKRNCCSAID
jgi:hypothetical protein